ncbi:hypothetical protein HY358_01190 [Candidatus Roizmanbacteria bacterium]|nr:hypothetical protein [Candidatus Roizmanbacteria bacterium]
MAYEYMNKKGQQYYLHSKKVKLRGSGKEQMIYFFARDQRSGAVDSIPTGYMVKEVERTGLPILKKK